MLHCCTRYATSKCDAVVQAVNKPMRRVGGSNFPFVLKAIAKLLSRYWRANLLDLHPG